MDIQLHLVGEQETALQALQAEWHCSPEELMLKIFDDFCLSYKEKKQESWLESLHKLEEKRVDKYEILSELGLVGAYQGHEDDSVNYKKIVAEYLDEKYPR
jgi:hypothetical protein